ncbi:penicillin-binding transpeptidase domain-containing protein [Kibdelosporangium aridum]|uniref:penicillin-binding transpeptidase domain-containing protein n=1 Tax=Kibdelosporangium aridum TaxID=2030 RepID=UPI0035E57A06
MNKRTVAFGAGALLLVVGLIATSAIVSDPNPEPVAQPKPHHNPAKAYWADGTELDLSQPNDWMIWDRARFELEAVGIRKGELGQWGYAIQLTVDPKVQRIAEAAVDAARAAQPGNLRTALVAVDPKTGGIVAYKAYQEEKQQFDYAAAWHNPGSAFTPFTLIALLHKGKGLDETYDGRSGRKFGGAVVNNSEGDCSEQCTVAEAMKSSVNTVFADIAFNEVGLKAVATAAIEAGIPPNIGVRAQPLESQPDLNIAVGGGKYVARPIDMAGAYATLAANGVKRRPHIVAAVKQASELIYDGGATSAGKPAFDPGDPATNAKIARTVTESLLPAGLPCAESRPCAGKPGVHSCGNTQKTQQGDSCSAWMVGYTSQISTAVWFGSDDNSAHKDKTGAAITGKGLPGQVWKQFMDEYLKGKPVEQFPAF